MHRLVLVLALAACGGGGGGDTFTPSQDLAATHGHLSSTTWLGQMRVDGIEYPTSLSLSTLQATPTAFPSFSTSAPGLSGGATFQAGGNRVRFAVSNFAQTGELLTTTIYDGTISGDVMSLTWRASSSVVPLDGATGTASLTLQVPAPVYEFVEVYEAPELLLVVRWVQR